MKITTIGIDLAKEVFQIHGVDERGKTVVKKKLRRNKLLEYFGNLAPCLIGMEACGGAHHWGRKLQAMGHNVKLMAPKYVKAYVKTNKNDAADAEAICEAVNRPNMRYVAIKSEEQQAILSMHRARQGFIKARTAQSNQIRGLLAEYGIVLPQKIANIHNNLPGIIEDADNNLPYEFRELLQRLGQHLRELGTEIEELEARITSWHKQTAASKKLAEIPGVGPITASAIVATVGDAKNFRNGKQLAAWLGLVPKQNSSGGKTTLQGISKRGDGYLRRLLIHGARSVIHVAKRKGTRTDEWLGEMRKRRPSNVVVVALANKNARIIWALLAHDRTYNSDHISEAPKK